MNDLISVIIPVYNREKTLIECIDSVISQTYKNIEIILVDDGSIDNSLEICKNYCSGNPKIKLFATQHIGVSAARNKALDEATGDYIFFMDSDDYIHPSFLEGLIEGMKKDNSQMASSKILFIGEKRWERYVNLAKADTSENSTVLKTNDETIDDFFHGLSPFQQIGGLMIKRSYMGDTRFKTDLYIGEDFYFIYQNLLKGAACTYLSPQRYYARIHSQNISNDYGFNGFYTRFYRRQLVWENEEALGRTPYANRQKNDAFSCFIRCFRYNKAYSKDAFKMRKILKYHKKAIFPALSSKLKILMFLAIYFPVTYKITYKLYNKYCRKPFKR